MPRILTLPAEIFDYFEYDPDTGIIRWKVSCRKMQKGQIAGTPDYQGYIMIRLKGKLYKAHRIAFALGHNTVDIPDILDHINGDKKDNRLVNLRAATVQQNNYNQRKQKNTTSKYKGVSWHPRHQKWQARIRINGKQKHLGYYTSEEEAYAAYCKVAVELHGEFANLN